MKDVVGFVGLGNQGGPMADRIAQSGMPLVVWARRPEVLGGYVKAGAQAAGTLAELGARCDHVGVCVYDDAGVIAIADALIPAMRPGSRLAIHSTVLPDTVIGLARRCAAAGIGFIDAPVSGGGDAAAAGTLTVMCGAEPDDFAAALPVFRTFGGLVLLLGPVGSGQRAKIVNNALLSANLGMAMAALESGAALGVDRAQLVALIRESSGRSHGFDIMASLPSPAGLNHGAPLLRKDMDLLGAVLPDHAGARDLDAAAARLFAAALGSGA